jgi:hypothetical protein
MSTIPSLEPRNLSTDVLRAELLSLNVGRVVIRKRRRRVRWELFKRDLRSHEPPRNSGEGTAVNGPMPLEGKGDALERP